MFSVLSTLCPLYAKPEDEAVFFSHYLDVHLPLVDKTPHLQKTVINRVVGSPFGEPGIS